MRKEMREEILEAVLDSLHAEAMAVVKAGNPAGWEAAPREQRDDAVLAEIVAAVVRLFRAGEP
jgi:hypothetical protein